VLKKEAKMSEHKREGSEFKARVALSAIRGEKRMAEL